MRPIGQRIWDDQVLSLAGIVERSGQTRILLGSCSYFQYLSVSGALMRESVQAKTKGRPTPLRDAHAATIQHLAQGLPDAQVAGFTAATVLTIRGKPHVLIQKRADETGVAGGRHAVVPAFVGNVPQVAGAQIDIARQLFYIELLEEVYSKDELVRTMKQPSLDWILQTAPVSELERSLDKGFSFERLGYGFDAVTGEFHQAYLAYVANEDLSTTVLKDIAGSWEMTGIELHPLHEEAVSQLLVSHDMYHTSAFTLSLAIERLS